MRWIVLICLLILFCLISCTTPAQRYPTETFHRTTADGRAIVMYGAPYAEVCVAIGEVACDGNDRCELEFFARCNPLGRDGIVETPTLVRWDATWAACLGAARAFVNYRGRTKIPACAELTPGWVTP